MKEKSKNHQSMAILILTVAPVSGHMHGTEMVARELSSYWAAGGHKVLMAAHECDDCCSIDPPAGVDLILLPKLAKPSRREQFARRSNSTPPGFAELVKSFQPDIAMVIGFGSSAINIDHVIALSAHKVPTFLWHHVPSITCQQHGLLLMNREPCDGRVITDRCAACRLTQAGAPPFLSRLASKSPIGINGARLPGALGHLIGGRALSGLFAESVTALANNITHTFVGAEWVREVLVLNGFSRDRISLVRPGLRLDLASLLSSGQNTDQRGNDGLRLVYWGRLDDTKGLDVAIRAVRAQKGQVTFDIIGGFDATNSYHKKLLSMAAGDSRITFTGRLEAVDLAKKLRSCDAAILASTWLETGPLTVFEAHAASLPILGSDYGGIGEICRNDPSARVFSRGSDGELATLIRELLQDEGQELAKRKALIPAPRTMADVANEITSVLVSS